jgi:hypothetical protein
MILSSEEKRRYIFDKKRLKYEQTPIREKGAYIALLKAALD